MNWHVTFLSRAIFTFRDLIRFCTDYFETFLIFNFNKFDVCLRWDVNLFTHQSWRHEKLPGVARFFFFCKDFKFSLSLDCQEWTYQYGIYFLPVIQFYVYCLARWVTIDQEKGRLNFPVNYALSRVGNRFSDFKI